MKRQTSARSGKLSGRWAARLGWGTGPCAGSAGTSPASAAHPPPGSAPVITHLQDYNLLKVTSTEPAMHHGCMWGILSLSTASSMHSCEQDCVQPQNGALKSVSPNRPRLAILSGSHARERFLHLPSYPSPLIIRLIHLLLTTDQPDTPTGVRWLLKDLQAFSLQQFHVYTGRHDMAALTRPSASQERSCASRRSVSAFCRAASSRRCAAASRSSALSRSVARPADRRFSVSSCAHSSTACAVAASRPVFAAAKAASEVASRPWHSRTGHECLTDHTGDDCMQVNSHLVSCILALRKID